MCIFQVETLGYCHLSLIWDRRATGCSVDTTIVGSKPHWIPETDFYLVHPEKLSPWLWHPHILILEHDRPVATALAVHQTVPLAANARGVVWPAVGAGQRFPDGRRQAGG